MTVFVREHYGTIDGNTILSRISNLLDSISKTPEGPCDYNAIELGCSTLKVTVTLSVVNKELILNTRTGSFKAEQSFKLPLTSGDRQTVLNDVDGVLRKIKGVVLDKLDYEEMDNEHY